MTRWIACTISDRRKIFLRISSRVDGLGGRADRNGDELITVKEMGRHLTEYTKALINQHLPEFKGKLPNPETYRGRDAADHILAHL